MYILDVETRGDKRLLDIFSEGLSAPSNYKDPDKIQQYIDQKREEADKYMAVDPDYNKIVCIGVKELGKPGRVLSLEEYSVWLQEETAVEGGGRIRRMNDVFITFNGKSFDIPVIIKAGIRDNINLPYQRLKKAMNKYNPFGHIDLMDEIAMVYGAQKSLDVYLKIYLGIKKNTGGEEFFRTASDEDLKKHCLEDLEFTEQLFDKFKVILFL